MKKMIKGIKVVAICAILAKILSFISELIIAKYLGTTSDADAYSMISGIHAVIYPMLGVGIWSLFLPEYKKKTINKSVNKLEEFANKVITLFLIISTLISVIIFIFSKQIISIISPGFAEETKNIASILLKIYSPYFIFSVISSIYAAMLQSHDKFLGSQIREIVSYLPTIILGPILYSIYDVYGFALALVFGAFFRLIVQMPFIDWKYKFKFDFNFRDQSIKKMIKKAPATLISSCTEQIHTLVDKVMASGMIVGSVSSLNYGSKLVNAVNGIFTNSIATVLYPRMSEMIEKKENQKLNEMFKNILLIIEMIIIPFMIIGLLYSKNIVALVYKRGQFDNNSVNLTTLVFKGYTIGIYFMGIKTLVDKFFYSLEKNNLVMKLNIINIITNILLNLILMKFMGLSGLAYATSISSTIYIILSLNLLNRITNFNFINYLKKTFIILLINLSVIVVSNILIQIFDLYWIISLIINFVVSFIIILLLYKFIKLDEFNFLYDNIKNTFVKKEKIPRN